MTVKVWSGPDFKLVKTLSGHEAKVTSLDAGAGNFSSCRKIKHIPTMSKIDTKQVFRQYFQNLSS
ncbi:hypothetical protein EZV62_019361 [Acer yangbiense]|uniref:Uncharacterized protein n=1 Tax=Acer yangbiense TaxID=1000413 RepID=A0A5C7HC29_9ROSI|nr:hypothetical protein EZV62_019361 [Acer yangbiense]